MTYLDISTIWPPFCETWLLKFESKPNQWSLIALTRQRHEPCGKAPVFTLYWGREECTLLLLVSVTPFKGVPDYYDAGRIPRLKFPTNAAFSLFPTAKARCKHLSCNKTPHRGTGGWTSESPAKWCVEAGCVFFQVLSDSTESRGMTRWRQDDLVGTKTTLWKR